MTRIDAHTHFLPEPYRDLLREWNKSSRIEDRDGKSYIHNSYESLPLNPGFHDIDARIAWMDEHDIQQTVVSVSTPNPNEGPFSVAESTQLVQAINEGFADLQADHPDRIAALGTLPLRDPEAALAELDRIAMDYDLTGVALPTAVRDQKLSHPDLTPVFDRLDDLGLPAFMHPRPNALCDELEDGEWLCTPTAIFPSETTIHLTRLLFDGFFDRHDFDLVVAHLGGTLPYLTGRIERGRQAFRGDDGPPEQPIASYLERFYYDCISFHPPAIRAAIETVGHEQLLFGTDYPFGIEDAEATVESVDAVLDTDAARAAVYGETAADVFDL